MLTKYLPKTKIRKEKNLLSSSADDTTEETEEVSEPLSVLVLYAHGETFRKATSSYLTGIM